MVIEVAERTAPNKIAEHIADLEPKVLKNRLFFKPISRMVDLRPTQLRSGCALRD